MGGQLPAGSIVTVSEIHMAECPHLGWCPCAFVSAASNTSKLKLSERRGWVRCAGKDGRNHIDERDQLEFEKVHAKIRANPDHGKHHHHHHGHHHHHHHHGAKEGEKKVQISDHPPQQQEFRASDRRGENNEEDGDEDSDYSDYS